MAQLVNRGLNLCRPTVFLPGVVGHTILQRQRASAIARIAAEDGAGSDVALLEMTPEQANAFRSGSEHHGSFPLSFPEHADFFVIGVQVHIGRKQTERLSYANARVIEEGKQRAITKIGCRNRLENRG